MLKVGNKCHFKIKNEVKFRLIQLGKRQDRVLLVNVPGTTKEHLTIAKLAHKY